MEDFIRVDLPRVGEGDMAMLEHECVPADKIEPGIYSVRRPPIFSSLLNVFDRVETRVEESHSPPVFLRVVQSAGYHLVRVALRTDSKENLEAAVFAMHILEENGCVISHNEERELLAIGIPPEGLLAARLVLSAESELVWDCKSDDRKNVVLFLERYNALDWSERDRK